MEKRIVLILVSAVLVSLAAGCAPEPPPADGVMLPTSIGTSVSSTTAPLALPTIIDNTATPAAPEFPSEPGEYFFDDFSDRSSGWQSGYAESVIWDYYQEGYRVSIYEDGIYSHSYLKVDYSNLRLVVDVRMIGGQPKNAVGLACRSQGIDDFYAAVINGEGYYAIYRRINRGELEVIGGDQQSVVINPGLNLNLVEMICVGDRIALIVNGQQLVEVVDSELESGGAGLFAFTLSAESTDILFDNFYLYLEE